MYLLHIPTMQLKHFSGSEQAPRYAILSHTWGTEHDEPEVLFQDWDLAIQDEFRDAMKRLDVVSGWPPKKKGRKLAGFCGKARSLGLEWGWVDTLCIDKRVSDDSQPIITGSPRVLACVYNC